MTTCKCQSFTYQNCCIINFKQNLVKKLNYTLKYNNIFHDNEMTEDGGEIREVAKIDEWQ